MIFNRKCSHYRSESSVKIQHVILSFVLPQFNIKHLFYLNIWVISNILHFTSMTAVSGNTHLTLQSIKICGVLFFLFLFFLMKMNKVGGSSVLSITALKDVNISDDGLEAVAAKRPPMRKIEIITNNNHSC